MELDNYYGDDKKIKNTKTNFERQYEESCCKQIVVILTSILGVISLGVLISLNVANLAEIYRSKIDSDKLVNLGNDIKDNINIIKEDIDTDIRPKTNLINTMTSYKIPTLITAHSKLLQTDIMKFCSPRYDSPGKDCPIAINPTHSGLFSMYDPGMESDCLLADRQIRLNFTGQLFQFASFIPSPTTPNECQRHPSFALSQNLYSYTHSIIKGRCAENSQAYQFWTIGKIIGGQNKDPVFESVSNWLITKYPNRRSCSTAVGPIGSWLACTVSLELRITDLRNGEMKPLTISYMDVYGKRRDWYYQTSDYAIPNSPAVLFFSIGSGIIYNNRVYFLAYGTISGSINQNAYCWSPGCPDSELNQTVCNNAQRMQAYDGRQMVNFIVDFEDNPEERPNLNIRVIPPAMYDIGSEGRLMYFQQSNQFYIYKKSASWHSLVFIGTINLLSDLTIEWFTVSTFSRPGYPPCPATNRCPRECGTGMYTDYFPLLPRGRLGISLILRNNTFYVNPTITIATDSRVLDNYSLFNPSQLSGYTTTTCFKFNNQLWCLGIFEISPGALGQTQPISIMFRLSFSCLPHNTFQNEIGSGLMEEGFLLE